MNSDFISPHLWAHGREPPAFDITDANKKPLKTVGYLPLSVRLGNFVVQLEFVVCNSLAPPLILGCDFCDRIVQRIRLRARLVEM